MSTNTMTVAEARAAMIPGCHVFAAGETAWRAPSGWGAETIATMAEWEAMIPEDEEAARRAHGQIGSALWEWWQDADARATDDDARQTWEEYRDAAFDALEAVEIVDNLETKS